MKYRLLPLLLLTASHQALAIDHIYTHDGAKITGQITAINADTVIIKTDYAGDLAIQRDKVASLKTDAPLSVRLKTGTTLTGKFEQQNNTLSIASADAAATTSLSDIKESWQPSDTDPELVRLEELRQAELKKWSHELYGDISGKNGNSDQSSIALGFASELAGKDDALKFYGKLDQAERDGEDTSDEMIVGAEYTAFTSDPWGWYVRTEFERDDFENLDLRALLGAGLNYRVFNEPKHSLSLRSGLGYRHETFNDGTTQQSPSLDFGLAHAWQFADWGKIENNLTYAPAIDDFNDYLLTHDSGVEIPLGLSELWQLKFGLRNDYKSLPAEGSDNLDTSYYSRIQLNW